MEAAPSLDTFFVLLENQLRRHLHAFVAAQAQAGIDVAGIASNDVRLLLQNLAKRWHSPQGNLGGPKKNLRLAGSPVIEANFLTILTVLNCFHHKSTLRSPSPSNNNNNKSYLITLTAVRQI
jgi:hypothetical protein